MKVGSFAQAKGAAVRVEGPVARPGTLLPAVHWQQVWFEARRRPWSSLAVVPAHPGTSSHLVAEALAAVGGLHGDRPVTLLDAAGAELPDVASVLTSLADIVGREGLAVMAVGDPIGRPASIPIARAAEAAILVVPLGEAGFADARRVLDAVGRDRFIGAVTFGPARKA